VSWAGSPAQDGRVDHHAQAVAGEDAANAGISEEWLLLRADDPANCGQLAAAVRLSAMSGKNRDRHPGDKNAGESQR